MRALRFLAALSLAAGWLYACTYDFGAFRFPEGDGDG